MTEDGGDGDGTSHAWMASAFAGGVAGSFTWAIIYPFDVIKTRIQRAPLASNDGLDLSIRKVGSKIIKDLGWRGMFRGLGVTLIRAFPVNGIIFPVYEYSLSKLTESGVCGGGG